MSARILRGGVVAALVATILGGVPATAYDESGSANTCAAAATSPEDWSERSGNVHNSGDLTDWFSHTTPANQRTITLSVSNDNVDLQVWTGDCAALLCASASPGFDVCTVTVSGRVKIRIVYPTPAAGVGVSNYTLRVTLPPECSDGYDNDGDALSDHPFDPDCTDPTDTSESGPVPAACGDRVDNDGDGRIDYPLDPGCSSADDTTEDGPVMAECGDNVDNDGDGRIDYPLDPGCTSATDTSETDPPSACNPTAPGVVACVEPGALFLSQPVGIVSPAPTTPHRIVGKVVLYAFPLPVGGSVTLPCVVLTVDSTVDPCAAAGGEPGDPIATLVDTTVSEQTVGGGSPLATVRVCHASLTVTVLGAGLNGVPSFALC